jgi:hypothetical protein
MGLKSWFSRLFGRVQPSAFTVDGIAIEKISVYALGREATMLEMLAAMQSPHFEIHGGGEGSRMPCSTEEYNLASGERDADVVDRIARETAAAYPGKAVIAFDWPESDPMLIAVFVTASEFRSPRKMSPRYLSAMPPS